MERLNHLYKSIQKTKCLRLAENLSGTIVPYLWRNSHSEQSRISAAVQLTSNDFFERVDVVCSNDGEKAQTLKVFFTHETVNKDLVTFYSPTDSLIYLYGKHTISLLNGSNHASISIMERKHKKAVFDSMEKGTIIHSPLARGLVICTTMYKLLVQPGEKMRVSNWLIMDSNKEEAMLLDYLIKNQTSIYE